MSDIPWSIILGKVMVVAAVQASFGSLTLSQRSLIHVTTRTQEDVDDFIGELYEYAFMGGFWMIGTTILMYNMHQYYGAVVNFVLQLLTMIWIIYRRYSMIKKEADKRNLSVTKSINNR